MGGVLRLLCWVWPCVYLGASYAWISLVCVARKPAKSHSAQQKNENLNERKVPRDGDRVLQNTVSGDRDTVSGAGISSRELRFLFWIGALFFNIYAAEYDPGYTPGVFSKKTRVQIALRTPRQKDTFGISQSSQEKTISKYN